MAAPTKARIEEAVALITVDDRDTAKDRENRVRLATLMAVTCARIRRSALSQARPAPSRKGETMTTRRDFLRRSARLRAAQGSCRPPCRACLRSRRPGGGYKALVCVFLAGGMDGHDTIIPHDAESYAEWAATRSRLLELYAAEGRRQPQPRRADPAGQHRRTGA